MDVTYVEHEKEYGFLADHKKSRMKYPLKNC